MSQALRASVAIPGVMPPIYRGADVLGATGAAINNLPVDLMQARTGPGDRQRCRRGSRYPPRRQASAEHFQILVHSGMINSAASAAVQRESLPMSC